METEEGAPSRRPRAPPRPPLSPNSGGKEQVDGDIDTRAMQETIEWVDDICGTLHGADSNLQNMTSELGFLYICRSRGVFTSLFLDGYTHTATLSCDTSSCCAIDS